MIDITSLTTLVSALRAETAKDSISPESLGAILQKILDLLTTAATDDDVTALNAWQKAVKSIKLVLTDITASCSANSVNINVLKSNLISGTTTMMQTTTSIKAATTEKAGVMTAQMVTDLNTAIEDVNEALTATTKLSTLLTQETEDRKEADRKLALQIGAGSGSATKYYLQCDSKKTDDGDILVIKGAAALVEMGFTPLIFRYTSRQGRCGHKFRDEEKEFREYQKLRKGWHLFYEGGKIQFDGDTVLFRVEEGYKEYTTDPKALFQNLIVSYREDKSLKDVRVYYGKKSYSVVNGQRFKFAIAFAKDPKFNQTFDFNALVTPLMEFKVSVLSRHGESDAEYHFAK